MISTDNIPEGFKPYPELTFCSNRILGGGHIFAMGKILPLLIGAGSTPRVWLQAVASPEDKQFVLIVSDSIAVHPAVKIAMNKGTLTIKLHDRIILEIESSNEQSAIVHIVDFRPLGLNIYGDPNALNLGGMHLSRNSFSGVGVAFGLGE